MALIWFYGRPLTNASKRLDRNCTDPHIEKATELSELADCWFGCIGTRAAKASSGALPSLATYSRRAFENLPSSANVLQPPALASDQLGPPPHSSALNTSLVPPLRCKEEKEEAESENGHKRRIPDSVDVNNESATGPRHQCLRSVATEGAYTLRLLFGTRDVEYWVLILGPFEEKEVGSNHRLPRHPLLYHPYPKKKAQIRLT